MLTSNEIRTVSFDRTIRGYRCEDVEAFLQQVADQFDQQQATMADLEKKLHILAQKIEEYRADEDTLKTALLNAQRMGENVIHEAKQKADSILREATLKSESLNEQAKAQVLEQQMELERVQAEVAHFKASVLGLYKSHIESLSTLPGSEPEPEQPAQRLADVFLFGELLVFRFDLREGGSGLPRRGIARIAAARKRRERQECRQQNGEPLSYAFHVTAPLSSPAP